MTARDAYQAIPSACIVAATNGADTGNGTLASPISLTKLIALDVWPGATIYLRGGTYTGNFRVSWEGNVNGAITVQPYPGETVVFDGSIQLDKPHTTWRGLEIYRSAWTTRRSEQSGSGPTDITVKEGFIVNTGATSTTIADCIVHDVKQGVLCSGDGLTVQDCLFYNNGWSAPDRGHGHSIYINNAVTPATIERNVFVRDYDDWGIHAYAEGASVSHITARDNVSIGKIMLFYTPGVMDDIQAIGNETWRAVLEVGQSGSDHHDIVIEDNYIVGAEVWNPLTTRRLKWCSLRRNTLVNAGQAVTYTTPNTDPPLSIDWDANTYHHTAGTFIDDNGTPRTFPAWQAARGLDAASAYVQALPSANRIRVIGGRVVVVYNWDGLASVAAPIAGTYRNALNPAESVVLAQGAALAMTGWTVATPIGAAAPVVSSTFPNFGCFLVTP